MYYFCNTRATVSMKCISNLRSEGTAEPLLVLNLCFPWDLWSLRGVGRSLCDYCLHTDLYLAFNYLRGSAACWCQYIPSFGTSRWKRSPLWFPPYPFSLCLWCWTLIGIHCTSGSIPVLPQAEQTAVSDIHTQCGIWNGGFMEIWSCCPLDM